MLYTILLVLLFAFAVYSMATRGPNAYSVRMDINFLKFGLEEVEAQAKQIDPSSPEKEEADKHLIRARFILEDALEKDANSGLNSMSGPALTALYKNVLSAANEVTKARQILRPFFPEDDDE